jgi:hypothetical protein
MNLFQISRKKYGELNYHKGIPKIKNTSSKKISKNTGFWR